MVAWYLAGVGISLHTKEGWNRVYGVVSLGIGRRSVHFYTDLGKDKLWVHAVVGLPYPALCAMSA